MRKPCQRCGKLTVMRGKYSTRTLNWWDQLKYTLRPMKPLCLSCIQQLIAETGKRLEHQ